MYAADGPRLDEITATAFLRTARIRERRARERRWAPDQKNSFESPSFLYVEQELTTTLKEEVP
jgi:hypothetical protein